MPVDFQHLSWEPLVPKEPKQLNSPSCVYSNATRLTTKYLHPCWGLIILLSVLWFDCNAQSKGVLFPSSNITVTVLALSATFSFLSRIVWSCKHSGNGIQHSEVGTHTPCTAFWTMDSRETRPLTFIIDFLQDPSLYQLLSALPHRYFPLQGYKQNTEKQA